MWDWTQIYMIPNSDNTRFYPSFSLCEMLSRRKVPLLILLQYTGSRFNSHLKPAAMAVWVSTSTKKMWVSLGCVLSLVIAVVIRNPVWLYYCTSAMTLISQCTDTISAFLLNCLALLPGQVPSSRLPSTANHTGWVRQGKWLQWERPLMFNRSRTARCWPECEWAAETKLGSKSDIYFG